MLARTSRHLLVLAALAATAAAAVADKASASTTTTTTTAAAEATACVAHSASGAFFDLRPDTAIVVEKDGPKTPKTPKNVPTADYIARGYEMGFNFTLNICGPVVKPVDEVVGLKKAEYRNVSAYYEQGGKVYSVGQQSSALVSRGRKLVLQYTGGSPCGTTKKRDARDSVHDGARYKYHEYGDDSDSSVSTAAADPERRKSATISFLCDRDPINTRAAASFVGVDPDECAYFFEVRSQHACAGAEPHKPGSVGPGSVFAIIFFIAVLVYLVGGVFYQRTVAHARGWRQLPNYSLWSGMWSFISDMATILFSSCLRYLPSRSGYRTLSVSPTGRGRNREDENRLIDQLDEEWDD